jgi:hypothetical protein
MPALPGQNLPPELPEKYEHLSNADTSFVVEGFNPP